MTSERTPDPAGQSAAPARRYSTGAVISAGLGGLAIGALAVFAVTGVTWKIRVELPPPPYPAPFSSTPPVSYLPPSPPAASTAPAATPSGLPMPPFPPGPH